MEQFCGDCCWFKFEDIDGDGMCIKNYHDEEKGCVNCNQCKNCQDFISNEDKERYLEVLQHWITLVDNFGNPNDEIAKKTLHFLQDYIQAIDQL